MVHWFMQFHFMGRIIDMKVQIRNSIFETNSSSTHALVMLNQEDYDKYVNGEIIISRDGNFITKEEYDKLLAEGKKKLEKRYAELWNNPKSWLHNEYDSLEEALEDTDDYDDITYEYDEDNMEIVHESLTVNGVTVHGLSVYGFEN